MKQTVTKFNNTKQTGEIYPVYTSKGKLFLLQARCGPEGGYRYSSTIP